MFSYYPPEDEKYEKYYNKEFLEDLKENDKYLYNSDDLDNILTTKGIVILNNKILDICFDDELDYLNVNFILRENLDDDGLIPIWIAISYDKTENLDNYELSKKYNGVGIFWSYDEYVAEPHSGSYNYSYILHGKVKPEYINWVETIYKSAYTLNSENEVELKYDTEILIYKITKYNGDGKSLPLKKDIVVPV